MVIYCLIKKWYYIPCIINKNGIPIEKTAQLLLQHVQKLHCLLLSLFSDRGSQFMVTVLKNLFKIFAIFVRLSTSFYSETHRQNEIANQKIEKDHCIFIHHKLDDLSNKLLVVKFTPKNNNSLFNKLCSFFASRDLY